MQARIAEKKDFDAIMLLIDHAQKSMAKLGIDQWQDGYPEPELIADDIRNRIGYVFDDNGTVAAYFVPLCTPEPIYEQLNGKWLNGSDHYLTLHRSAIDDPYRGTGLSNTLIRFCEEKALDNGMSSVRADTHRGNIPMRRLLEKNGFIECGLVSYDVTDGDPLRVAYEKLLK